MTFIQYRNYIQELLCNRSILLLGEKLEEKKRWLLHKHRKIKHTSFADKCHECNLKLALRGLVVDSSRLCSCLSTIKKQKQLFQYSFLWKLLKIEALPHTFKPTEYILCDWALTCCWNVGGNWRTQRKSTHGENMKNLQETDSGRDQQL